MELLALSIICLVLAVAIWLFYTVNFLEHEFSETIGVPSTKIPVMFILDAIKAIHLLRVNGRPIPSLIQAHAMLLVLSVIFILLYLTKLDGYI